MSFANADILIVAGIGAGWLLAWRHAAIVGVPRRMFLAASALCIGGAVLGGLACMLAAPAGHAVADGPWWQRLHGNLLAILLASSVPPLVYLLVVRGRLADWADIAGPSFLLTVACVRVACFMKGCCWGDVCCSPALVASTLDVTAQWQVYTMPAISGSNWPFAIAFAKSSPAYEQHFLLGLLDGTLPGSLPCHPVQLYEAVFAGAAAVVLSWYFRRRIVPLRTMAFACIWYACMRFVLEFLRADHTPAWHGLTSVQISCMALAALGTMLHLASLRATHPAL